jgi:hypothetical protein
MTSQLTALDWDNISINALIRGSLDYNRNHSITVGLGERIGDRIRARRDPLPFPDEPDWDNVATCAFCRAMGAHAWDVEIDGPIPEGVALRQREFEASSLMRQHGQRRYTYRRSLLP